MEESVGHQHGNFHSYYNFHPVVERTQHLIPGMFYAIWEAEGKPTCFTMLDVGCNEGDLSIAIALSAANELPRHVSIHLLGVDLDSELIRRGRDKLVGIRSQSTPFPSNCTIAFETIDLCLPEAFHEDSLLKSFLSSIDCPHGSPNSFSFVSLFSVTMWVHLHVGDKGFAQFLKNIAALCSCSMLIEPQPWKCYRSAARRLRKQAMPPFPFPPTSLKLVNIDEAVGMIMNKDCGMSEFCWSLGTESWGRSLVVFHRERKPCLEVFGYAGTSPVVADTLITSPSSTS